ncbi:MAG: S8 family peptidase [bacterium]
MRFKSKLLIVIFAAGLVFTFIILAASEKVPQKEVFIKFVPEAKINQIDSLTSALGLTKVKSLKEINVDVYRISSNYSVNEVVQLCSNLPYVIYAEPTAEVRAFSIPEKETPPEVVAQVPAEVPEFKPGEVIIKFKSVVSAQSINTTLSNVGIQIVKRFDEIGVLRCSISSTKSVLKTVEECNTNADIEYAEPNYIYRTFVTPNDPRFSQLYGMTIIEAPQAWDMQTGSRSVIVGVIDTGVDTDHDDLKANIWRNPGETGDGKENNNVDDDGNGFVDDYRGWDFINDDNNPFDDNNHGTHVSGTIGAEGNNSTGVVGVNWQVTILPMKFLGADGSGPTDDAVDAIIYGTNLGAKVLSNSWGGGGRSQALEDAIKFANDHGVIFVAAAGNESTDNDRFPSYPANYEVANVISVAASTSSDNLAGFSNRGEKTVDLAAPGSNILSTIARNRYESLSGTSMATPHVSGAAALVWAQYPGLTMRQIMIRILGSVDRNSSFAGKVATGGRLNVNRALSTNPIIANTTRLENTLDEVGPYIVEADILDDGNIQSATLTYQVLGQNAVTVTMTATTTDHYQGEIPGQSLGSSITYFVQAKDDGGNETRDNNFTFSIAEPTNGGGCCGKPAIDVAIQNPKLKTSVNAIANISFFVLPFIAIKVQSNRKKKRTTK